MAVMGVGRAGQQEVSRYMHGLPAPRQTLSLQYTDHCCAPCPFLTQTFLYCESASLSPPDGSLDAQYSLCLQVQASDALQALAAQLLPQITITSLSLSHSSAPSPTAGTDSKVCRHYLTVTRYDRGSAPILMTLPIHSQALQRDGSTGNEPSSSSVQEQVRHEAIAVAHA